MTNGIASSPYQALRVLQQLEKDEAHQYKKALGVLTTETYVDDIITSETIPETLILQHHKTKLLSAGGLELKKWVSNCTDVLRDIPVEYLIELWYHLYLKVTVPLKFLVYIGTPWGTYLVIIVSLTFLLQRLPSVLSAIPKIYDPLGVLCPVSYHLLGEIFYANVAEKW